MNITVRPFQKQDTNKLSSIIRDTWHYDQYTSAKIAEKLGKLYLYSCLVQQSYNQVVLTDQVPAGIIMVKNNKKKGAWHYLFPMIGVLFSLFLSKEGRKTMKIFQNVNQIDQELLKQTGKKYDGEICFFVVDAKVRGKGLGKLLFSAAINYMKQEKIQSYYLYTDVTCNYLFYEHQGMHKKCEKQVSFSFDCTEQEMSFFLYDNEE